MSITDEFVLRRCQTLNAYYHYGLDCEQIIEASHLTNDFYNLKFFSLSYETTFSHPAQAVYCFNEEMPSAFYTGDISNLNVMTHSALISSYHFLILYLAEMLGRNKKYPQKRRRIIAKLLANYHLHSQMVNNPYNLFARLTKKDYEQIAAAMQSKEATRASILLDKYNNPDIPAFAQTHALLVYVFEQLEHNLDEDQAYLDLVYEYLFAYDFMGVSFAVMLSLLQFTEKQAQISFPGVIFEFSHEPEFKDFVLSFVDSYLYTMSHCMGREQRDNQELALQITRQWLQTPDLSYMDFMRQQDFSAFAHKFKLDLSQPLGENLFEVPSYEQIIPRMLDLDTYKEQLAYFNSLDPYQEVEQGEEENQASFSVRIPCTLLPCFSEQAKRDLNTRMLEVLDTLEQTVYSELYYPYHDLYVKRLTNYNLDLCDVNMIAPVEFMYARFYSTDSVLLQNEWLARRQAMLKYQASQSEDDKVALGYLLDPAQISKHLHNAELCREQQAYWQQMHYIYRHPTSRTASVPLKAQDNVSHSLPPGVLKYMQEKL